MNDLTILEISIDKSNDKLNKTYVTEEGKDLSLTPDTAGEAMRIMDKIDELREVMRHCNHSISYIYQQKKNLRKN